MNIRQQIFGSVGVSDSPLVTVKKPKGATADMLHTVSVKREESRRGDMRLGDRHRIVGESASVTHGGATYDAQLINICGSGAMISAAFQPLVSHRLKLHLDDDRPINCKVLWIRDGHIGLEFTREIRLDRMDSRHAAHLREVISRHLPEARFQAPAKSQPETAQSDQRHQDEQRAQRRNAVIRLGTLHYDYQSTPTRLRDVSAVGVMIESEAALAPGAEPLIDLGDAGSVFGTVVWAAAGRAGLRFNQPFDWTLLLKRPPEPQTARWQAPAFVRNHAQRDSGWEEHWRTITVNELNENLDGLPKR